MMNNVFKDAYLGKPYKTRDEKKAIFYNHHNGHAREKANYVTMILEGQESIYRWYYDGTAHDYQKHLDIISEWQEPIVCKCQWTDYYDYRIMMPNGEGHVRVSFFQEETIISDLFVAEEHRHKGYASILLDKVDELLAGRKAIIYPLEEWQREWYEQRGYIIGKEDSVDEEKLDELAYDICNNKIKGEQGFTDDDINVLIRGFKECYRNAQSI